MTGRARWRRWFGWGIAKPQTLPAPPPSSPASASLADKARIARLAIAQTRAAAAADTSMRAGDAPIFTALPASPAAIRPLTIGPAAIRPTAVPLDPRAGTAPLPASALSDIERLLCGPTAAGHLETLVPRSTDAWHLRFPGLGELIRDAIRDDAPGPGEAGTAPRICIATDQITGPVRNGGIGTTYAALAIFLANAAFDVTVLYLRGSQVETETIDHWIADYASRGVKLVPVPDYAAQDGFQSGANRWMSAPYNMMRYLIDHPMDVVHVSEWRGSGYLSLLAKRQGLAFSETLFVVKTSSPWLWNRLYGGHAIDKAEDLSKIQAERASVEMADIVVGGSQHLLRWMASQGYALPPNRSFVQPNLVTFANLEPLMHRRALTPGQRAPINEFVFFGRLEARKGLFLFCQAIRRLIRQSVPLPPRITFMGKSGGRMPSHPDQEPTDYIRSVTADWPTHVQILSHFQQFGAIEYLLGGARLAVMPSVIENSSMAIYEAAICAIPCIATAVGGNSELIDAADHDAVLCQPHPVALGDKLAQALAIGGMVPRPSFDNAANLAIWRAFHERLGTGLRETLLAAAVPDPGATLPGATSLCIYYTGDAQALAATLASVAMQQTRPAEVLVALDDDGNGDGRDAWADAAAVLDRHGWPATIIPAFDLDAGAAFNAAAAQASAGHLLFLWQGATLKPWAIAALEHIARADGAAVLTWLHRPVGDGDDADCAELRAVLLGASSDSYFRDDIRELPLFVDRGVFAQLDGFTGDYRVLGYDHEFVAKARLAGLRCETAMLELGTIRARTPDELRLGGYDLAASAFRATRPLLAAAPLALRDTLLYARGQHLRGIAASGKGKGAGEPLPDFEQALVRMMTGLPFAAARADRVASGAAR